MAPPTPVVVDPLEGLDLSGYTERYQRSFKGILEPGQDPLSLPTPERVIDEHATTLGIDPIDYRLKLSDAGVELKSWNEQVGRKGLTYEEAAEEARRRGVSAFLPPEERELARTLEAKNRAIDRQLRARGETRPEASGGIQYSDQTGWFLGADADDTTSEVSQENEEGWKQASIYLHALLEEDNEDSDDIINLINTVQMQLDGAAQYADAVVERRMGKKGLTPGSPAYQEARKRERILAIREIAMMKTVGMWTGPAILPGYFLEDRAANAAAARARGEDPEAISYDPTVWDALKPNIEIIGVSSPRPNSPAFAVVRQQGVTSYIFDIADALVQAPVAGMLSRREDESLADAAVRGISSRHNFLDLAMGSDAMGDALMERESGDTAGERAWGTAKAAGIGLAGLAWAMFSPDAFGGIAGVGKLVSNADVAARAGLYSRKADQQLTRVIAEYQTGITHLQNGNTAEGHAALQRAAAAETELRGVGKGLLSQTLDAEDAAIVERLAQEHLGLPIQGKAAKAAAKRIPGEAGNVLTGLSPSERKRRLARRDTVLTDYTELFNFQRHLADLDEAERAISAGEVGIEASNRFKSTILDPLSHIEENGHQLAAGGFVDKAVIGSWMQKVDASLSDLLLDPTAWLATRTAEVHRMLGPSGSGNKAQKSRRQRMHKQLGIMATRARNFAVSGQRQSEAVDAIRKAREAVMVSVESRFLSAVLTRQAHRKSAKITDFDDIDDIVKRHQLNEVQSRAMQSSRLSPDAQRLQDQLINELGMEREDALLSAVTADVIARGHAAKTGRSASEWWSERIAEIQRVIATPPSTAPQVIHPSASTTTFSVKFRDGLAPANPAEELMATLLARFAPDHEVVQVGEATTNAGIVPVFGVVDNASGDLTFRPQDDLRSWAEAVGAFLKKNKGRQAPPTAERTPPSPGYGTSPVPRDVDPAPSTLLPGPFGVPPAKPLPPIDMARINAFLPVLFGGQPKPGTRALMRMPDGERGLSPEQLLKHILSHTEYIRTSDGVEGFSLRHFIHDLAEVGKSDVTRLLAARLAPLVDPETLMHPYAMGGKFPESRNKAKTREYLEEHAHRLGGYYQGGSNHVILVVGDMMGRSAPLNEQVIVHEALHAVTAAVINRATTDGLKGRRTLAPQVSQTVHDLEDLAIHLKTEVEKRRDAILAMGWHERQSADLFKLDSYQNYLTKVDDVDDDLAAVGIEHNVHELIAYGLTNPDIQLVLREVALPGYSVKQSLFGRFVKTLGRLFNRGRDLPAVEASALDRLLRLSDELFDRQAMFKVRTKDLERRRGLDGPARPARPAALPQGFGQKAYDMLKGGGVMQLREISEMLGQDFAQVFRAAARHRPDDDPHGIMGGASSQREMATRQGLQDLMIHGAGTETAEVTASPDVWQDVVGIFAPDIDRWRPSDLDAWRKAWDPPRMVQLHNWLMSDLPRPPGTGGRTVRYGDMDRYYAAVVKALPEGYEVQRTPRGGLRVQMTPKKWDESHAPGAQLRSRGRDIHDALKQVTAEIPDAELMWDTGTGHIDVFEVMYDPVGAVLPDVTSEQLAELRKHYRAAVAAREGAATPRPMAMDASTLRARLDTLVAAGQSEQAVEIAKMMGIPHAYYEIRGIQPVPTRYGAYSVDVAQRAEIIGRISDTKFTDLKGSEKGLGRVLSIRPEDTIKTDPAVWDDLVDIFQGYAGRAARADLDSITETTPDALSDLLDDDYLANLHDWLVGDYPVYEFMEEAPVARQRLKLEAVQRQWDLMVPGAPTEIKERSLGSLELVRVDGKDFGAPPSTDDILLRLEGYAAGKLHSEFPDLSSHMRKDSALTVPSTVPSMIGIRAHRTTPEQVAEIRKHYRAAVARQQAGAASRPMYLGERGATRLQESRQLTLPGFMERYSTDEAERLLAAGEDAEAVRRKTGWFRSMDGKWRYEIDDSGAALTSKAAAALKSGDATVKLGDFLDHPTLLRAYPGLANIEVDIIGGGNTRGVRGSWTGADTISLYADGSSSPEGVLSTLLHEIQHGVQSLEGMARGGVGGGRAWVSMPLRPALMAELERLRGGSKDISPAIDIELQKIAGDNIYRRLAGEVEARDVQHRQAMTQAERVRTGPDVAEDAVVIFRGGEARSQPDAGTNLKKWFGSSKIVNDDGTPMVVYHATNADFDTFKVQNPGWSNAHWFGPNPDGLPVAHQRRGSAAAIDPATGDGYPAGHSVMPVFLRMENPQIREGSSGLAAVLDEADVAKLKAEGYDGIIWKKENAPPEYIVFDANQIKSATGNSGAYSLDNDSILASRLDAPRAVDTPAFQSWFDESKVLDEAGEPLVVYHGTRGDFDTFQNPYMDEGASTGAWSMFSTDPDYSGEFASGNKGSILPVYLSIKKPLDLTRAEQYTTSEFLAVLKENGLNTDRIKMPKMHERTKKSVFQFVNDRDISAPLARQMREQGFDGIKMPDQIYSGEIEGRGYIQATTWIVLDSKQVKSATGNSGAFSPEAQSILKALAGGPSLRRRYLALLVDQQLPSPTFSRAQVTETLADVRAETSRLAREFQAGRITREVYEAELHHVKPVVRYSTAPPPAALADMRRGFGEAEGRRGNPKKLSKLQAPVEEGRQVQLRLDIPSYTQQGVWTVAIHAPKSANASAKAYFDAGKVVSYDSVARVSRVNDETPVMFGMDEAKVAQIAAGDSGKSTVATINGRFEPISPEEARAFVQREIANPQSEWTQVGMDPTRHSYFYTRDTIEPVVSADEVIQIGGLVLARNIKKGERPTGAYDPADSLQGTGTPLFSSGSNDLGRKHGARLAAMLISTDKGVQDQALQLWNVIGERPGIAQGMVDAAEAQLLPVLERFRALADDDSLGYDAALRQALDLGTSDDLPFSHFHMDQKLGGVIPPNVFSILKFMTRSTDPDVLPRINKLNAQIEDLTGHLSDRSYAIEKEATMRERIIEMAQSGEIDRAVELHQMLGLDGDPYAIVGIGTRAWSSSGVPGYRERSDFASLLGRMSRAVEGWRKDGSIEQWAQSPQSGSFDPRPGASELMLQADGGPSTLAMFSPEVYQERLTELLAPHIEGAVTVAEITPQRILLDATVKGGSYDEVKASRVAVAEALKANYPEASISYNDSGRGFVGLQLEIHRVDGTQQTPNFSMRDDPDYERGIDLGERIGELMLADADSVQQAVEMLKQVDRPGLSRGILQSMEEAIAPTMLTADKAHEIVAAVEEGADGEKLLTLLEEFESMLQGLTGKRPGAMTWRDYRQYKDAQRDYLSKRWVPSVKVLRLSGDEAVRRTAEELMTRLDRASDVNDKFHDSPKWKEAAGKYPLLSDVRLHVEELGAHKEGYGGTPLLGRQGSDWRSGTPVTRSPQQLQKALEARASIFEAAGVPASNMKPWAESGSLSDGVTFETAGDVSNEQLDDLQRRLNEDFGPKPGSPATLILLRTNLPQEGQPLRVQVSMARPEGGAELPPNFASNRTASTEVLDRMSELLMSDDPAVFEQAVEMLKAMPHLSDIMFERVAKDYGPWAEALPHLERLNDLILQRGSRFDRAAVEAEVATLIEKLEFKDPGGAAFEDTPWGAAQYSRGERAAMLRHVAREALPDKGKALYTPVDKVDAALAQLETTLWRFSVPRARAYTSTSERQSLSRPARRFLDHLWYAAEHTDTIRGTSRSFASEMVAESDIKLYQTRNGIKMAETVFRADGKAIIRAFQKPDASTIIHELAHIARRDLNEDDMGTIARWVEANGINITGHANGRFTGSPADITKAEELFARGFESYLAKGDAPSSKLERVYARFQQALVRIYSSVTGAGLITDLPDDVRKVFDDMVTTAPHDRRPLLPRVLAALRRPVPSGPRVKGEDAVDLLLREARRLGVRIAAGSGRSVRQLSTKEDIVEALEAGFTLHTTGPLLQSQLGGVRRFDQAEMAKLQRTLDADLSRTRGSMAPRPAAGAKQHGTPREDSPVDALQQRLAGDSTEHWKKAGRIAVGAFFGGDPLLEDALRLLPPEARKAILAGTRLVEQSFGESIRLIADGDKAARKADVPELIHRYLGGESIDFADGREVLSSGYPAYDEIIKVLGEFFTHLDSRRPGSIVDLSFFAEQVHRAGSDRGRALASLSADLVTKRRGKLTRGERAADLFKAIVNGDGKTARPEFVQHFFQALDVHPGMTPEPRRTIPALEILTYYAGVTLRNGQDLPPAVTDAEKALRVKAFLDEIGTLYSPDKAARVAVVMAGHGNARRALDTWGRLGIATDAATRDAYGVWVSGGGVDPVMLPKVKDLVDRLGMNAELVNEEGMFDIGTTPGGIYVPAQARTRMTAALTRGQMVDPSSIFFQSDTEMGGVVGTIVRYMKKRMTRGGFALRQRYFAMNTLDHFYQLAMTPGVGVQVGAASTARLMMMNVTVVPGVAKAIHLYQRVKSPAAAKKVRQKMSKYGDKIGAALSAGKWRLEVNRVMDGDNVHVQLGGRTYLYKDLRQIAVEEGIFSTFDTSQLRESVRREYLNWRKSLDQHEGDLFVQMQHAAAKKAGPAGAKIQAGADAVMSWPRRVVDDVLKNVEDTAEAWGERERIGAMVTLIEQGHDPRAAARLTIDALYDYAGSMSKFDRHWLVNLMLPFWAFQKNANRAVFNNLLSPEGAYRMAVLRHTQEYGAEFISHLLYQGTYDTYGIDTESLPPDLRQRYFAFRHVVEFGYGSIETIDADLRAALEGIHGKKLEELDDEALDFIENGYGGPHLVPDGVRLGLRATFSGHHQMLDKGKMYQMDQALINRMSGVHEGLTTGEGSITEYFHPGPQPAGRATFRRPRAGVAFTPRMNEAARIYYGTTGMLEGGHSYMELFVPESTIVAGMNWMGNVTAAMLMLGVQSGGKMNLMEHDLNLDYLSSTNAINEVMEVTHAPIPAVAMGTLGVAETDLLPSRISPVLARGIESHFGISLFRLSPGMKDPFIEMHHLEGEQRDMEASEQLSNVKEERYYLPPGAWNFAFNNSPVGELNQILLRSNKSTLESTMGTQGEVLRWARIMTGAETAKTQPMRQAKVEEPRDTRRDLKPPSE